MHYKINKKLLLLTGAFVAIARILHIVDSREYQMFDSATNVKRQLCADENLSILTEAVDSESPVSLLFSDYLPPKTKECTNTELAEFAELPSSETSQQTYDKKILIGAARSEIFSSKILQKLGINAPDVFVNCYYHNVRNSCFISCDIKSTFIDNVETFSLGINQYIQQNDILEFDWYNITASMLIEMLKINVTQLQIILLFDIIFGNVDRHFMNILYSPNGQVYPIDHDLVDPKWGGWNIKVPSLYDESIITAATAKAFLNLRLSEQDLESYGMSKQLAKIAAYNLEKFINWLKNTSAPMRTLSSAKDYIHSSAFATKIRNACDALERPKLLHCYRSIECLSALGNKIYCSNKDFKFRYLSRKFFGLKY